MVVKVEGKSGMRGVDAFVATTDQLAVARAPWRRCGKGSHPAALNFGDCSAYALANTTGEPLLFKGDFAQTDIVAAT